MNRHPWTAGRVFLLAGGCAALLAAFTATAAHSQGISAQAKVLKPDPPPDINALRQQLLALQQRVEKLEKEKQVEQAKPPDDAGDEARAKKIEQRLANLEKHHWLEAVEE